MFFKIDDLKNFAIFAGKYQWWSLFFNFIKETPTPVFSCEYCKILKNRFFTPLVVASVGHKFPYTVYADATTVFLKVKKYIANVGKAANKHSKLSGLLQNTSKQDHRSRS